jgi:hypothetical protein
LAVTRFLQATIRDARRVTITASATERERPLRVRWPKGRDGCDEERLTRSQEEGRDKHMAKKTAKKAAKKAAKKGGKKR